MSNKTDACNGSHGISRVMDGCLRCPAGCLQQAMSADASFRAHATGNLWLSISLRWVRFIHACLRLMKEGRSMRAMKAIFITSLICALMSLLAVVDFSAMTILPGSGAESWHGQMMFAASVFFVGWLCLASWARRRTGTPPNWLRRSLAVVGVVYVFGVLLFVGG